MLEFCLFLRCLWPQPQEPPQLQPHCPWVSSLLLLSPTSSLLGSAIAEFSRTWFQALFSFFGKHGYKHPSPALFQPKQATRFVFAGALAPLPAFLIMLPHPHLQVSFQMPLDLQATPLSISGLPATLPPRRLCSCYPPGRNPLPNLLPHLAPCFQTTLAFSLAVPILTWALPRWPHLLRFQKVSCLSFQRWRLPDQGVSGHPALWAPSALSSVPAYRLWYPSSFAWTTISGQGLRPLARARFRDPTHHLLYPSFSSLMRKTHSVTHSFIKYLWSISCIPGAELSPGRAERLLKLHQCLRFYMARLGDSLEIQTQSCLKKQIKEFKDCKIFFFFFL